MILFFGSTLKNKLLFDRFKASVAVGSKYFLFWDGTRRRLVLATDVSGQFIRPIFKDETVQEDWNAWPLKTGRLGSPETSAT